MKFQVPTFLKLMKPMKFKIVKPKSATMIAPETEPAPAPAPAPAISPSDGNSTATINYNEVLGRESIANEIAAVLNAFHNKKNDLMIKRGIYIYGNPGVGKTEFVMKLLKTLNYDIVKYDAGDIRNKCIIDMITNHNMSEHSVLSMFQKKPKRIAIVMDEIDGMNSGDKGGINTLIKLMRPKKTKKQRLEDITMNPIICVGNYHMYKKIR